MSPVPAIDQQGVKLGWRSLLAFGQEANYGERATPDRSFEFRSESLTMDQERIESEAIRRSEFSPRWGEGTRGVEGDVTFELANKGFGLLFLNAFGEVATTETVVGEVWEHVFTAADLTDKSLTCQVVRDDVPFDYTGLKIGQLQLSCQVGQIATVQLSLVGRDEQTDQTEHAEAFPSDLQLLTFIHGSLEIDDEEIAVNEVQNTLNNGLNTDRRRLGSGLRRNPQRTAFRDFTGNFNADFTDLALYNRFISGEHAKLVQKFEGAEIGSTGENYSLTITSHVRFDGNTPTVGGPDEIRQEIPFKAFPTDTEDAVEFAYVTDDETP